MGADSGVTAAGRVRLEERGDGQAVRRINESAFGRADEANLIDELKRCAAVTLSLVFESESEVLGHIVFSPVTIESGSASRLAVGLGPMAVTPDRQSSGIGSALVREGLTRCRDQGEDIVVVLGHPLYYPRFGFRPARQLGLRYAHEVADEVFMALRFGEAKLGEGEWVVHYHPTFDGV